MEATGNLDVKSAVVVRVEGAGKGMTDGVARSVRGRGDAARAGRVGHGRAERGALGTEEVGPRTWAERARRAVLGQMREREWAVRGRSPCGKEGGTLG